VDHPLTPIPGVTNVFPLNPIAFRDEVGASKRMVGLGRVSGEIVSGLGGDGFGTDLTQHCSLPYHHLRTWASAR
jgi:hypothetical protein